MYQILSESVRFCRRYDKKRFGAFFGSHCSFGGQILTHLASYTRPFYPFPSKAVKRGIIFDIVYVCMSMQ